MQPADHASAARALRDAAALRVPIPPLTDSHDMTTADAYAIQRLQTNERATAHRVLGHKVGLSSAAMQQQFGVDQPDYGVLFDDMAYAEHDHIDIGKFIQPRIEPEIAFVLAKPLRGPGVTTAHAAAAVDFVLPSLEIVDSRIADWKITFADTVADNASAAGFVLGARPTPLSTVDLRLTGCLLHRGGELVATGAGGAVMGNPLASLVWLANTLGVLGVGIEEGDVVLPGSITGATPVHPGDTFTASFAELGTVTAHFAGAATSSTVLATEHAEVER